MQFLLTDAAFPRSVAHCLAELTTSLEAIAATRRRRRPGPPRPRPAAGDGLAALVASTRPRLRTEAAAAVDGPALRDVVDRLQISFAELHDAIAATHFGVGAPRWSSSRPGPVPVAVPVGSVTEPVPESALERYRARARTLRRADRRSWGRPAGVGAAARRAVVARTW